MQQRKSLSTLDQGALAPSDSVAPGKQIRADKMGESGPGIVLQAKVAPGAENAPQRMADWHATDMIGAMGLEPVQAVGVPDSVAFTHGQDSARGLKGGRPGEREAVRGVGDMVSDASDVVGAAAGNLVGGIASAVTGISISSTTNAGPTFGPQGAAMWHVAFATSGRTGWIVQKIDNTVNGTDAGGTPMTPATIGLAPHYYEAWSVDAAGTVTPSVGGDNDHWDQGGMGAGSKGHWSTRGTLYWLPGAAMPGGMAAGAVPNAGMLVSSFAAPAGLGVARLHRYAHANWDATVIPGVDTGSAS